jgi:uncharacterized protein (TIGR03083 family)
LWLGVSVDTARLLDCLATDVAQLRDVAARDLTAPVPTCPGWAIEDLVRHVANLYLNVVVRRLRMPEDVSRQDLTGEEPLAALDRCYTAMIGEFAGRDPRDHVGLLPHETVYYWIRRMAHETVIHRVDAELAFAGAAGPIPPDIAVDGLDELLMDFVAEVTRLFPEEFAADLSDWADRWVLVSAGDTAWRVTVRPDRADVTRVDSHRTVDDGAAAGIGGEPAMLLCWLYNRVGTGHVVATGDGDLIAQLRRLATAVTNTG